MNKNENQYQAFIFDMDGTIVDTIEDMKDSVNYALRQYSLPEHTTEEYKTYVGNGSVLLVKRALGKDHQDMYEKVFDTYYNYYHKNFCVKTKAFEGLIQALDYAKSKGILLFIYTNKPEKIALEVERRCFGEGYFTALVGIPLGGKTKPDPKAFFLAAEPYHLDYSSCAYFGDSTTDLETAHNLGIINRYSVLWGYQSYQTLSSFPIQPKAFLYHPSEIKEVVDRKI